MFNFCLVYFLNIDVSIYQFRHKLTTNVLWLEVGGNFITVNFSVLYSFLAKRKFHQISTCFKPLLQFFYKYKTNYLINLIFKIYLTFSCFWNIWCSYILWDRISKRCFPRTIEANNITGTTINKTRFANKSIKSNS